MDSISTLTAALEALNGERERSKSLEADLRAAQALLEEQSTQFDSELKAARALLQEQSATLEAAKAAAQQIENVNELRVNEVLASVGVAPVDVQPEGNQERVKSREDLWAEYHALDLPSRNAFFQKHKAQLSTL